MNGWITQSPSYERKFYVRNLMKKKRIPRRNSKQNEHIVIFLFTPIRCAKVCVTAFVKKHESSFFFVHFVFILSFHLKTLSIVSCTIRLISGGGIVVVPAAVASVPLPLPFRLLLTTKQCEFHPHVFTTLTVCAAWLRTFLLLETCLSFFFVLYRFNRSNQKFNLLQTFDVRTHGRVLSNLDSFPDILCV